MNENVTVCITPKGDKQVLHFSQFDNGRIFTVTVLADDGETAAVLTDLDIEFRIRKTDSHVVTIAPESVSDNVITFKTTEQMCACCGQNIAAVTLMKDDMVVSTLDILVDIQRDILSGGLTSESDIRNLTTQIETIIPEVLADDYYTKTEVDDLIADIPTFDPTNYYDKSDVDTLLSAKADASNVYTKGETDTLLATKADSDDVYTKNYIDTNYYTNNIIDTALNNKADNPSTNVVENIAGVLTILNLASDDTNLYALTTTVNTSTSSISVHSCGKNIANFLGYLRSSAQNITIEATPEGSIHYYGQPSSTYCQLTFTIPLYLPAGSIVTLSRSQAVNYQHYMTLTFADNTADYLRVTANNTSSSFTLEKDLKSIDLICLQLQVGADYDETISFQFELGDQATFITPYRGTYATASLGTSVNNVDVDLLNGIIKSTPEATFTPIVVPSYSGKNHIIVSTGNIKRIEYFKSDCSALAKLIRAYVR